MLKHVTCGSMNAAHLAPQAITVGARVGRNKMRISARATMALFLCAVFTAAYATDAAPSQGKVQIPDFSGIWAHLTFPDVELPLKGLGPVRNLSHVTPELARTMAPYNGTSASVASGNVSNLSELVGDFTNPILKPE